MTNAGFTIVQSEIYEQYVSHDTEHIQMYGVCIGRKPKEYVTWEFVVNEKGEYSYFWGHYFTSKNRAFEDYHRRLIDKFSRRIDKGDTE